MSSLPPSVTVDAFVTSVVINCIVLAATIVAYAILRHQMPDVFLPRWLQLHCAAPPTAIEAWKQRDPTTDPTLLREPPKLWYQMFWHVISYPEGEVLAVAGLDAYVFLRTLKLGQTFFSSVCLLLGFAVLVPISATAPAHETTASTVTSGFDYLSIANIPLGSPRLWAHVVSVYVFTAAMCWLIYREYTCYLPLRYAWLSVPQPSRFSVLVVDLPEEVVDDKTLFHHIDRLYPGQVHSVCMVTKSSKLDETVEKRNNIVRKLERERLRLHLAKERMAQQQLLQQQQGGGAARWSTFSHSRSVSRTPAAAPSSARAPLQAPSVDPSRSKSQPPARANAASARNGHSRNSSYASWFSLWQGAEDAILQLETSLARLDDKIWNLRHYAIKDRPDGAPGPEQLKALVRISNPSPDAVPPAAQSASAAGLVVAGVGSGSADGVTKQGSLAVATAAGDTDKAGQQPRLLPARQPSTAAYAAASSMPSEESRLLVHRATMDSTIAARTRHKGVYAPTTAGFVTFNNLATAATAPQVLNTVRIGGLRGFAVLRAPEPRDVNWENVGMAQSERAVRQRIASALAIGLVIVYVPLTSAVSTLTSLESISKISPAVAEWLGANKMGRAVVEGYLPSLALTILLALVPKVLRTLAIYGGSRSESDAVNQTVRYLYIFKVVTVFLIFSISGSIWGALDDLINSPLKITTVLAGSLPKLATFFSQFIILQALSGIPLGVLVRIWPIIKYCICRPRATTASDQRELRDDIADSIGYDGALPDMLTTFVIALAYMSMAPIVSPCAMLYFATSYLCYKNNLLYVHVRRFETGGSHWPIVVNRILVGLVIYQITMIGLLGLKEAPGPSAALIPTPFLVAFFWNYIDNTFKKQTAFLPVDCARDPDSVLSQLTDVDLLRGRHRRRKSVQGLNTSRVPPPSATRAPSTFDGTVLAGIARLTGPMRRRLHARADVAREVVRHRHEEEAQAKVRTALNAAMDTEEPNALGVTTTAATVARADGSPAPVSQTVPNGAGSHATPRQAALQQLAAAVAATAAVLKPNGTDTAGGAGTGYSSPFDMKDPTAVQQRQAGSGSHSKSVSPSDLPAPVEDAVAASENSPATLGLAGVAPAVTSSLRNRSTAGGSSLRRFFTAPTPAHDHLQSSVVDDGVGASAAAGSGRPPLQLRHYASAAETGGRPSGVSIVVSSLQPHQRRHMGRASVAATSAASRGRVLTVEEVDDVLSEAPTPSRDLPSPVLSPAASAASSSAPEARLRNATPAAVSAASSNGGAMMTSGELAGFATPSNQHHRSGTSFVSSGDRDTLQLPKHHPHHKSMFTTTSGINGTDTVRVSRGHGAASVMSPVGAVPESPGPATMVPSTTGISGNHAVSSARAYPAVQDLTEAREESPSTATPAKAVVTRPASRSSAAAASGIDGNGPDRSRASTLVPRPWHDGAGGEYEDTQRPAHTPDGMPRGYLPAHPSYHHMRLAGMTALHQPQPNSGAAGDEAGGEAVRIRASSILSAAEDGQRIAYNAQRSVYLRPCFRPKFDLHYECQPIEHATQQQLQGLAENGVATSGDVEGGIEAAEATRPPATVVSM